MQLKSTLLLVFSCLLTILSAQKIQTPNFWQSSSDLNFRSSQYERQIIPDKYYTYNLDLASLDKHFQKSLTKTNKEDREQSIPFYMPNPDGEMELYHLWRDDLLPKKLNDKFPEISVFAGYSPSDPTKTIRVDITSKGFRAVSYGTDGTTYYIDPIAKGVKNTVISYYKKDYTHQQDFECLVEDVISEEDLHNHSSHRSAGDCQLHTFRLALACTGEYAAFHGGTVASVMAEFTTSINRINGLFEKEIGVNLVLTANTDQLIFLNPNTDPYSNNDGGSMLGENQTTCDNVIGSANYDIGHVYSTGGGGIARLFSPCNSNAKAQGVTGLNSPVGDPFYIDYVAHEMGHQFGATHSYNNSCSNNRTGSTAYEPGSGSTIMAYAGICPPNVQFSSDAYFHSASLVQMGNFLTNISCQTKTDNGSDRPIIAPLNNYTIPVNTPFELNATASVSDGSSLTYCWEQMDREIANMPPEANATDGPSFRSYAPTLSNSRYFPSLPFLLDNSDNQWEVLPGATRELNFRCTVRGSAAGRAGCTEEADLVLNVSNTSGPFQVTAPNNAVNWVVGETQSVEWQVANTTSNPVNCSMVNILLSFDGGFTYPITILENTPNDGQVDIEVPDFPGNQNRIRVQSVGNVFFDISNSNFTIAAPIIPTFTMSADPTSQSVCGSNAGTVSYDINTNGLSGFDDPVTLSVTGLPSGVSATFNNNHAVPDATTTLNLTDLDNVSTGQYIFTVTGNGDGQSDDVELTLEVKDNSPTATALISPANVANDVSLTATLNWQAVNQAEGYVVELSDAANFNNIIFTTTTEYLEAILEGLNTSTVYYWRVRSTNICGEGPNSEMFRFRTGVEACNTYTNDNAVPISVPNAETITSQINVPAGATIESMQMSTVILHTWVGDLEAELISPQGTEVKLFDRPGLPASGYGCPGDNIRVTFDDAAANSAAALEATCSGGLYAIDDTFQSIDPLANFAGNNSTGDWTLQITDNLGEDGGRLVSWTLEICTSSVSSSPPSAVNNNALNVLNGSSENITSAELLFTGNGNAEDYQYTLITLPSAGTLIRNNILLQPGDVFTQADVNTNLVYYEHSGNPATTDNFMFDTEEVDGGWAPNNVFHINIIESNFTATASQAEGVACFGGNNAAITIAAAGGQEPYIYSIDGTNFQASNSFGGLIAGTYTATVTDANDQNTTTNTIILDQPEGLEIVANVNENTVTLSVTGGTGALSYSLDNSNFQNSNVFSELPNGDYNFYVMDANGCVVNTETISISVNDLSLFATNNQDISCFNGNDAVVNLDVAGGNAPYTYFINNNSNGQSSNAFENLGPGEYSFSVIDANGFSASSNLILISNPTLLELMASTNGAQITASATGGTANYQYSIDGSNYQTGSTFDNLNNGIYTVYVQDENDCVDTEMVTISVDMLVAVAEVQNTINCAGDATGVIVVNGTGGTAPYMYGQGNGFQQNNQFDNLTAGNYTFFIQDANQQETSVNIVLDEPASISLIASTDQAAATLTAQGGTPPYIYSMDGGNFQQSNLFDNLSQGAHEATVLDAFECAANIVFNININALAAEVFLLNPILCTGDESASIVVEVSEGTSPFEYSLDATNFQAEEIFENLEAGDYTVMVRDADNLETTANITIDEPAALSLSAEVQSNAIILTAVGGTSPYQYRLDNGDNQTANQFFNLDAGTYTMTVQDANECTTSISTTITFVELSGEIEVNKEIDCAGNSNGEIEIFATGGSAPYTYSIDGNEFQSDPIFPNLSAGQYTAIILDSNGIEFTTTSVLISEPKQLLISLDQNERQLIITVAGGTGDLSYSIDGDQFQTSNIFENIPNGTYTAYVMDARACQATAEFDVLVNDLVGIASVSQAISCSGGNDGIIVVETSGGTNPKEFSIDGVTFQTSNFFSDLSAGDYAVTIRDANGLTTTTNIVVLDEPAAIQFDLEITNNILHVTASGGSGSLLYSIDGISFFPKGSFPDLENGEYTLYIRDANNCDVTEVFVIDFTELNATMVLAGDNLCAGDADVTASITATGGTPPYTYAMAGGVFSDENTFENLAAGEYTFAVQDAVGAIFTLPSITVEEPSPLNLVAQVNGNAVMLSAQGGTLFYEYSIGDNVFQQENIFQNLMNGDYTAVVMDDNRCVAEFPFTINVVQALSLQVEVLDISDCSAQIAGTIQASGMGGTAPYLYSLNGAPFQSDDTFENLGPGQYTVSVQDAAMNTSSSIVVLTTPNILEMNIAVTDNDIEINVIGGQAPYSYSINGGQSFSDLQIYADLDLGDYEVVVTDANGCEVAQMISILSTSIAQVNASLIFAVQPNPAQQSTTLLLDLTPTQTLNISIVDILGRTVRSYKEYSNTSQSSYELNLFDLAAGTYLVRVEMDGQLAVRKLVVQ